MKAILATVLILALGITGISLWRAAHGERVYVSSSQIFIHGTPVCVMQHGGEIVASIGTCRAPGGELREDDFRDGEGFHGGSLSPLDPDSGLPPGHPPVDSPLDLEGNRRILI